MELVWPKAPFSKKQRQQIQNRIDENKGRLEKEYNEKEPGIARRAVHFCLSFLSGGSALMLALRAGLSTVASAGIGVLFFGAVGIIRRLYFNMAVDSISKHSPLQNEATRKSLEAGIEATTWPGYFNSFRNFDTIKAPLTFRAGLEMALDKDVRLPTLLKRP